MKKDYMLNTLLAFVLGMALLVMVLVRAFFPQGILPKGDLTELVLVSLAALVLEAYLAPGAKRNYVMVAGLGAVTFALLPWCAGFADFLTAGKLGLAGGGVFAVVTWLYSSMLDRIRSGPEAKAAAIVSAFGIYLAAQGLMGLL